MDVEIEDGDRIFATDLHQPPEEIRATSTISQRLAEAFKWNQDSPDAKKDTPILAEDIPAHLREFSAVLSKESFDVLPDPKPWDHAIELIPGGAPSGCKVYPLSPSEQKELDGFLNENLETGRIRPSKSPMASPVFFIKKKDGALQLVQDYRALNAITVKNKYPLPLISELIEKLRGARYCQRTPQSTSHYSRLPQRSPIHPSTQTTKPPDRSLTYVSNLRVQPTCPTYVSNLHVRPTCPPYVSNYWTTLLF